MAQPSASGTPHDRRHLDHPRHGIALALLLIGLFAWLRSDMKEGLGRLGERLSAVERDVSRLESEFAFMHDQLSLVIPALVQPHAPPATEPDTD